MHVFQLECIPVGCVTSAAVAVLGGGGVQGVCVSRGCSAPLLWTEFLKHAACENITFQQLRTVMIINKK